MSNKKSIRKPAAEATAASGLAVEEANRESTPETEVAEPTGTPEAVSEPEVKTDEAPEPAAPVAPGVETKAEHQPVDLSKISFGDLDRKLLFRYIYAMIQNQTHGRVGAPGIKRWGEMLGITNYQDQIDLWRQIKEEALKQIGPTPEIVEIKSPQQEG